MIGRTIVMLAVLGIFLSTHTPVYADIGNFINNDKYEDLIEKCDEGMYKRWDACVALPPRKEPGCRQKAVRLNTRCKANAAKNAVFIEGMPDEAQIEYAKVYTKQENALNNCKARAENASSKCDQRYSNDETREKACKDKVELKHITCRENALNKYPLESKKLKRLLSGKRP